MEKARINPIEQQTMLQGQPSNLRYQAISPEAQMAAGLSKISSNLGNVLYEQNKRLEKLKFADNDEKLKITSGEMNLALSKAKNQEEFDSIKKEYMDKMKTDSKFRLGKSYDKWEGLEGQNFMAAMEVDVKGHQIALNDKIAKETAVSTMKDFSYQWAYAKDDSARAMQDVAFADYLDQSGFNDAEKERFTREYNHDKEHGYLTVEITRNPAKVKKLLSDPNNFDNLSVEEREAFSNKATSIMEETQKAKNKGFDDILSQKIGEVTSQQKYKLATDIAYIKSAKENGKINPEKLDFARIMGTLDYIDALSKDPLKMNDTIVQNSSGQVYKTLTPEEALKYKEEILPYLMSGCNELLAGNTGVSNNSVYTRQLALLSEAARNSGKMTAYQISDLMTALWRENQKDDGTYLKDEKGNPVLDKTGNPTFVDKNGRGWAIRNLDDLNDRTGNLKDEFVRAGLKNVERVMNTYNLNQGNTGVATYTVSDEVPYWEINEGGATFHSVRELQYYKGLQLVNEARQNLAKNNPFVYASMLAAEKNF